jgi:hypothetical protein
MSAALLRRDETEGYALPPTVAAVVARLERRRGSQRERELAAAQALNAQLTRETGQRVQMELAIDELLAAHARGALLEHHIAALAQARRPYLLPNERHRP